MKPRPTIHLLSVPRSNRVQLSAQCRRSFDGRIAVAFPPSRHSPRAVYPRPAHPLHASIRFASATAAIKSQPATSSRPSKPSVPVKAPAKSPARSPSKSPTSNVPVPQVRAKLNPPPETYAPDLVIPAKKPSQNHFKYLYQCGKLYIEFYKQGISNVRTTAKIAKSLRQKAEREKGEGGRDGLGVLTRAEWQIVRRSRKDIWRLPPFGIMVLVFGEWLPLMALYITPLIPEPCRIPAQIQRKLQKAETLKKERERRLALDAARLVSRDRKPGITSTGVVAPQAVHLSEVKNMDLYTLLSLSTTLNCHSWAWDKMFMTPPKAVLKWGVRRKMEYLKRDDALIERDGGWAALEKREMERACMERGLRVLGRKEEELRKELAGWFRR
ncbi:hypothetical protein K458DRAFT_416821 [Lentithecium fluviatile CBS 122367]|uniref:Letm1 RBD domain-containing protein n=1 Tax=Lentithecium fluviatile CBS 122367 TaxID=1168545 RepID=A0A6G1J4Y8_9PLEO|nr:hypothetical protein K458DRAFT_416821 [Lentithecium fluviatile CBS 122367]